MPHLPQTLEFFVLFQKECQILIGHIHFRITSQAPMFFLCLFTAGKSIFINLILDLIRSICHVDAGTLVTCAHFGLRSLEGREELGMDKSWFWIFQFWSNVARQPKVRILIYGAWDEARYVALSPEDLRETRRKRWRGLNGGEMNLSNVITRDVSQAE